MDKGKAEIFADVLYIWSLTSQRAQNCPWKMERRNKRAADEGRREGAGHRDELGGYVLF